MSEQDMMWGGENYPFYFGGKRQLFGVVIALTFPQTGAFVRDRAGWKSLDIIGSRNLEWIYADGNVIGMKR